MVREPLAENFGPRCHWQRDVFVASTIEDVTASVGSKRSERSCEHRLSHAWLAPEKGHMWMTLAKQRYHL